MSNPYKDEALERIYEDLTVEVTGLEVEIDGNPYTLPVNVIATVDDVYERLGEQWHKIQSTIEQIGIERANEVLELAADEAIESEIHERKMNNEL